MSYLLGEGVNLGVGVESERGTGVTPQIWIPARTPSGISIVMDKALIKETRRTRMSSEGSEAVMKRAEGDLEFNVRNNSIGYLLKSLLGSVNSAPASGEAVVYEHEFTIDKDDPQNPSLTVALSQPGQQDYEYPLMVVSSLELNTPVDDLVNATINMIAKNEAEHGDYSVAFEENDYYFRNYDVTIKIADDLAGLDAAEAMKVKEFKLSMVNNARPNQNIGDLNPDDVIGLLMEITGDMTLDYVDTDIHDIYADGTYKAMRIEMVRDDVTIGYSENPRVTIDLARVSFEKYEADRPIDDIVMEKIGFQAHYAEDDVEPITVTLVNEIADYNADVS